MITPNWAITATIILAWFSIADNHVSSPIVVSERDGELLAAIDAHPFATDKGLLINPFDNKVSATVIGLGHVHSKLTILWNNSHLAEQAELVRNATGITAKLALVVRNYARLSGVPGYMYGLRTVRRCHHNDRKIHYKQ